MSPGAQSPDDVAYITTSMNAKYAAKKMLRALDLLPEWLAKWRLSVNRTCTVCCGGRPAVRAQTVPRVHQHSSSGVPLNDMQATEHLSLPLYRCEQPGARSPSNRGDAGHCDEEKRRPPAPSPTRPALGQTSSLPNMGLATTVAPAGTKDFASAQNVGRSKIFNKDQLTMKRQPHTSAAQPPSPSSHPTPSPGTRMTAETTFAQIVTSAAPGSPRYVTSVAPAQPRSNRADSGTISTFVPRAAAARHTAPPSTRTTTERPPPAAPQPPHHLSQGSGGLTFFRNGESRKRVPLKGRATVS
ncbi:hypothetical protein PYW07_013012 [Mythimna separata]|uniref:Uncharacterized protein n=1 Tax=Mythimna separata TaxID=271217 RepID=A0AAD8DJK6_MYTSE|nr:hypothetical protein PYW07_013012 [Mythimna separata]